MKKVMIYCQYLAGIGHLVRTTEIIRCLVQSFQVCLVNGGQIIPQFDLPPAVEVVYLPGLREDNGQLQPIEAHQSLAAIKAKRQQLLLQTFDRFSPDCLITECFPFSKIKMAFELMPLLERVQAVRQNNRQNGRQNGKHPIQIICSLRDLIMTQTMSAAGRSRKEANIVQILNQYYDAIFCHGDPNFQSLQESFTRVNDLSCTLIYTGYVAPAPQADSSPENLLTAEDIAGLSNPTPSIVASVGGGRHGYPLLSALIAASPLLANTLPHHIYAFAGPLMPEADFAKLQQAASGQNNLTLRRYTARLVDYLQKADLSVSLGGYNTTMNVLKTGVRSLILPSPNQHQANEQRMRAQRLSDLGVLQLLDQTSLGPHPLAHAITSSLNATPVAHALNLNGASTTAQQLEQRLYPPTIRKRTSR